MPAYSSAIDRALRLAAVEHREQVRKGSDVPYVAHPVMVAMLLLRAGMPDDVVVAGLLHDIVEDQDIGLDEIGARFGEKVRALVASVTELKTEDGKPRPWRVRKEEALAHLEAGGEHVAALKAADSLHNCMSTLIDLETVGPSVWSRFKSSREEQLWYYSCVTALTRARLGDNPLVGELEDAVAKLEAWPEK